MSLERTTDVDKIRAVVTHHAIWPHVRDDGSGHPRDFVPDVSERCVYLVAPNGDALFLLHRHNAVLWEVHSAVLPEARHRSLEFALACRDWVKAAGGRGIVTYVPEGNMPALGLALKVGFQLVGNVPRSLLVDGELLDQAYLHLEID